MECLMWNNKNDFEYDWIFFQWGVLPGQDDLQCLHSSGEWYEATAEGQWWGTQGSGCQERECQSGRRNAGCQSKYLYKSHLK